MRSASALAGASDTWCVTQFGSPTDEPPQDDKIFLRAVFGGFALFWCLIVVAVVAWLLF